MSKARLGIIGCGGIFYAHAPRLEAVPEAEIVAFCDIRPEAAEKWRAKIHGEGAEQPIYTDYKKMIDSEKLDGVLVLTPHVFHYEQAKYALESGVNVLLEKPMCTEVAQCEEITRLAEAKGLKLLISYQRHYMSEYTLAKRFIEAGGIGKVQLITGLLTQDWQRGCKAKDNWRIHKEISGGGQLNDSGSHLQDITLWFADSRPAEVKATVDNNGEEVDIFSSISARLENGVILSLVVSGGPTPWNEEISIFGSEGAIHYRAGQWRFVDTRGNELDPGPRPEEYNPDANFVKSILTGEEIWATPYNGQRVQELTRAAYASSDSGKLVKLRDCVTLA